MKQQPAGHKEDFYVGSKHPLVKAPDSGATSKITVTEMGVTGSECKLNLHKPKVFDKTKKWAENGIHAQGTDIEPDIQIKGVSFSDTMHA